MKRVIVLAFTILLLAACSSNKKEEKAVSNIVTVSIIPQKFIVEKIAGDEVYVNLMIPEGSTPHTYEPTPKQVTDLSKSKAYFKVGLIEFEDIWMEKLKSTNKNMTVLDMSKGCSVRHFAESEHHEHHHDGEEHHDEHEHEKEHGHDHEKEHKHKHHSNHRPDPHNWISAKNLKIMAQNTASYLTELYPDKKNIFEKNLKSFIKEIDDADKIIKDNISKARIKEFIVFHPSWGYFADEYGLEQISMEVEGKVPSVKTMQHIAEEAKEHSIKLVIIQKQFDPNLAKTLAEEIGGTVKSFDPLTYNILDSMIEISKELAGQ